MRRKGEADRRKELGVKKSQGEVTGEELGMRKNWGVYDVRQNWGEGRSKKDLEG